MTIFTGITNFAVLPCLMMMFRRKMLYQFYIGVFTLITSFMYHTLESIEVPYFILSEYEWHKLDNVGSITCFIMLIIYLGDSRSPELDTHLNYSGLIIVLISQEKDTWNVLFTVWPILLWLFIVVSCCVFRDRKPNLRNKKMFRRGILVMFIAFFFFYKGLDEFKDYLRMSHGMWHMCVAISSFYIWQSKVPEGEEFSYSNLLTKPVIHFHDDSKYL